MLSEELILHFIPKVFKGYTVREKSLIRATRNADIDADALYDEDLDYREFMADIIKRRKRLAPIRMEMSRELGDDIVTTLCKYMDVSKKSVFRYATPLDLSFLFQLQDVLRQRTELFYPKRFPQRSAQFAHGESVLAQIRQKDKLLAYPFESMKPFLSMLREAASDDKVVSIKMTLYRVAKQSEVVEALCEAAENGKDVLVLVELKARFDEENNIEWSRRLESAGCNVIYGLNGFKVHSKLCLITRMDGEQVEYFTQIGTGNYNEKTARLVHGPVHDDAPRRRSGWRRRRFSRRWPWARPVQESRRAAGCAPLSAKPRAGDDRRRDRAGAGAGRMRGSVSRSTP